jgi:hypothetical protein
MVGALKFRTSPHPTIGDTQIRVELTAVNGRDPVDSFDLQDNGLLHDDVRTVGAANCDLSVDERQRLLRLDSKSGNASSKHRHSKYALSRRPGPTSRCMRMAASMTVDVIW